jgi:hypothetical protein
MSASAGVCDFQNPETDALNFIHGFDLRIASLTSQKSSKLTVTINSGIIHFGHENVIVFFENFLPDHPEVDEHGGC